MKQIYTISIGDNHALFREGIKSLLSSNPAFNVISEGEDGMDVVRAVQKNPPDLLLLDLSMPKMNGLDVIKNLKNRFPNVRILVLTIHNTEEYIHAALDAGADGYLLKDADFNELEMGIKAVLRGQTFLSPGASGKVVEGFLNHAGEVKKTSWSLLTKREREHLKLIAEAHTNKDIADYLHISIKTVEKHRANLMKKLDLHSAVELTAFAIEKGLVDK